MAPALAEPNSNCCRSLTTTELLSIKVRRCKERKSAYPQDCQTDNVIYGSGALSLRLFQYGLNLQA